MDPFEALAEPAGRRIIEFLASGEHTSGQLADVVGVEFRISRTAVSKHLRLLRDGGFVDVRAEENWRWYRLSPEGFRSLESIVAELTLKMATAVGWDAEAGQLRDPLAAVSQRRVPYRGPGRPPARGRRGRQTTFEQHASPDDLEPVRPQIYMPYEPIAPSECDGEEPRLEEWPTPPA